MPFKHLTPVLPLLLLLLLGTTTSRADNCDAIRAQIDAKIRTSGLSNFELAVVEPNAPAGGRVVGSCGNGARRIVYRASVTSVAAVGAPVAAAAAPHRAAVAASAARDAILTECLDGTMSVGGTCKK